MTKAKMYEDISECTSYCAAVLSGGIKGFYEAQNVPITPEFIDNLLVFGPTIYGGIEGGIKGLIWGYNKETLLGLPKEKTVAATVAGTSALTGILFALSTAIGYGMGYAIGYSTKK